MFSVFFSLLIKKSRELVGSAIQWSPYMWPPSPEATHFHMATISENKLYISVFYVPLAIRDFTDHATFRENGAKLASADKLGVILSLTLCYKANFDPLQHVKCDGLEKM